MKSMIFLLMVNLLILANSVKADSRLDLNVQIEDSSGPFLSSINDSTVHVLGIPGSVEFNSSVHFTINAYRGKTLKRTLYTYIIGSDGKKISTQDKFSLPVRFQSYNFTASLSTKSACGKASPFYLVVEGLDIENRTEIDMICPDNLVDDSSSTVPTGPETASLPDKGSFSFDILDFPDEIVSDQPFKVRILIQNPTEDFMDVEAWSYIYRSSVCFSGDREVNRKTINIPEYSNVTFDLENTVSAPPGDYKLKVKILLPDLKTPKELTKDIKVIFGPDMDDDVDDSQRSSVRINSSAGTGRPKKIINSQKLSEINSSSRPTNSSTVYLSSSAKARRLIPIGLIITLTLLLIGLILRNF